MAAICGIYFFEKSQRVDKRDLARMADKMLHRGSGGTKYVLQHNSGLAYRYSHPSHIDDSEPTISENSMTSAVMDGCIYNCDSLAHSLQGHGYRLQRTIPSELLISLYRENDLTFLPQLDGAFSFAIWDQERNRFILSRDRFGVKPLYYFEDREGVIFASEIKAILEVLREKPSVNLFALQEYLTFRYVSGSSTMFVGIKELLPGHCIVWSGNNKIKKQYWSAEDALDSDGTQHFDREDMESLLKEAIKKRIRYAHRVGANCSGGIDSGLVTAFTGPLMDEPLNTFTVGFEEKGWDERYFAALTAKKYNSTHHELVIKSQHFSENLPQLNWYNDEPLSDPNSVLVSLLAHYSKDRIDLLLTGEGADEVFLGYPRYNLLNFYSMSFLLPQVLRSVLIGLISLSRNRRLKKLTLTLQQNPSDAIVFNSAFVHRDIVNNVINKDLQFYSYSSRHKLLEDLYEDDYVLRTMAYEIKTYLLSSLNRLDKMNMACGLETATPFLDNDLFEFALRMPKNLKIRYLSNKCALRELAKKYLPPENLKMPKSGFGVPISKWFVTDSSLREILNDLKGDSFINQVCNKDNLNNLIHQHINKKFDFSEILWLITNLYLWHKQFF